MCVLGQNMTSAIGIWPLGAREGVYSSDCRAQKQVIPLSLQIHKNVYTHTYIYIYFTHNKRH